MISRIEKRKTEIIVDIFLLVFVLVLAGGVYHTGYSGNHKVTALTDGWYQMIDGEKVDITLPASLTADDDGVIEISNDSLKDAKGQMISIHDVTNELQVSVGDKVLYTYTDSAFIRNEQLNGKLWADITVPDEIATDPITLTYSCQAGETISIQDPYIGDHQGIESRHLQDNIFSIMVVAGMFALGIVAILIYIYGFMYGMKDSRLLDVSAFLIICAIWCLTDCSLYQMYGDDTGAGGIVSFYCFMLMAIPVIHFIQNTGNMKKYKTPHIFMALFYANAILQGIIYACFQIPFVNMLFATHILLFAGVVSMTCILLKEYKEQKDEQLEICIVSFACMGLAGLVALVLYWALEIYWYGVIFQAGILLSIVILIWGVIKKIASESQIRAEEDVYERLSNVDRLTGLRNRKAFDQYLLMVQTSSVRPKDTVLVFIYLKNVRKINDSYGNTAGDEMIVGAARCIQRTCEIFEKDIKCFRVHGDEFAVVLLPGTECQEWERRLNREVEKYNRTGHYPVCLTCGYGNLEGQMGTVRNLSQWKGNADDNLRKNKGDDASGKL